jgi:hypothetical protein
MITWEKTAQLSNAELLLIASMTLHRFMQRQGDGSEAFKVASDARAGVDYLRIQVNTLTELGKEIEQRAEQS